MTIMTATIDMGDLYKSFSSLDINEKNFKAEFQEWLDKDDFGQDAESDFKRLKRQLKRNPTLAPRETIIDTMHWNLPRPRLPKMLSEAAKDHKIEVRSEGELLSLIDGDLRTFFLGAWKPVSSMSIYSCMCGVSNGFFRCWTRKC